MVDIGSALLTTITGLIGVIIGASVGHYVNHKIARQEGRRETLFKKRLEYFEQIIETIIKNIQIYKNAIKQLEKSIKKREIDSIIKNLKKNRKKFEVMSSPLYFDTRLLSSQIKHFVNLEKAIFYELEKMSKTPEPRVFITVIKGHFEKMNKVGREIIFSLREDISKT